MTPYKLTYYQDEFTIIDVRMASVKPEDPNASYKWLVASQDEYNEFFWFNEDERHFFANKISQLFDSLSLVANDIPGQNGMHFKDLHKKLVEFTWYDGHKVDYQLIDDDIIGFASAVAMITDNGKEVVNYILDFGKYIETKTNYPNVLSKLYDGIFTYAGVEPLPHFTDFTEFDATRFKTIADKQVTHGLK